MFPFTLSGIDTLSEGRGVGGGVGGASVSIWVSLHFENVFTLQEKGTNSFLLE